MRVLATSALRHQIDRWGIASQQQSRRNAMIALTALTQRRAELIEIEQLLAIPDRASAHEIAASAASL